MGQTPRLKKMVPAGLKHPQCAVFWLAMCLSIQCIQGYVKFSSISDFRQPCILKTAGLTAKQTKIWASVGKYAVYAGYF